MMKKLRKSKKKPKMPLKNRWERVGRNGNQKKKMNRGVKVKEDNGNTKYITFSNRHETMSMTNVVTTKLHSILFLLQHSKEKCIMGKLTLTCWIIFNPSLTKKKHKWNKTISVHNSRSPIEAILQQLILLRLQKNSERY